MTKFEAVAALQRRIRRAWEESHPGLDWDEWNAR